MRFKYSELEYLEEECREGNEEFESYYRSFCSDNDISINELETKNKKTVKEHFRPNIPVGKEIEQKDIDASLSSEQAKKRKIFQRIFHGIAKKIHPDKFSGKEKTVEIIEKEEQFKKASYAFDNGKWGTLLEIAEDLKVQPQKYEKINNLLRDEVSEVNEKIKHKKSTFGWRLYNANSKRQKDKIIISFLKMVFNYDYKK